MKSPKYRLRFTLPKALSPRKDEIAVLVDQRVDEFLVCCSKWRSKAKCKAAIASSIVRIINDYTFRCGVSSTGLCAGDFGGSYIRVCLYNKINTDNPHVDCSGIKVRTRKQMSQKAGGNSYWLKHPNSHFCGSPNGLLPGLVHELCHNFGDNVGHVAGREECQ